MTFWTYVQIRSTLRTLYPNMDKTSLDKHYSVYPTYLPKYLDISDIHIWPTYLKSFCPNLFSKVWLRNILPSYKSIIYYQHKLVIWIWEKHENPDLSKYSTFWIVDLLIFGADPLPLLNFYIFWAAFRKVYFDLNESGLHFA